MAGRSAASASAIALWILVALGTFWFLRAAQSLLIPIALAGLISYALEPAVAWLERRHVHRVIGSAAVVLMAVGGVVTGAFRLQDDARQMVEALPTAAERVRDAVGALGSSAEALARVAASIGGRPDANGVDEPTGTSGQLAGSLLQGAASAVFGFAGHAIVIVFLVFFLLVSWHQVRNRVVEVMGPDGDRRTTTARIIDDINHQIQRYLVVLLFTAAVVGVSTWLVLDWLGARHAVMWGLLAGVFNSIPYFGPVIVSGGLLLVGIVQGGPVSQALQMSAAAMVITSVEGWLIAPPLMGKVERMSVLAVFLGLLLWTWVWGAWGTILAVPMLVIMKSVADHVDRLRPLGRLMAP
jgi:predicted PurR-regulated permease PerM